MIQESIMIEDKKKKLSDRIGLVHDTVILCKFIKDLCDLFNVKEVIIAMIDCIM